MTPNNNAEEQQRTCMFENFNLCWRESSRGVEGKHVCMNNWNMWTWNSYYLFQEQPQKVLYFEACFGPKSVYDVMTLFQGKIRGSVSCKAVAQNFCWNLLTATITFPSSVRIRSMIRLARFVMPKVWWVCRWGRGLVVLPRQVRAYFFGWGYVARRGVGWTAMM